MKNLEKTVHEAGRAYTEGRYDDARKLYENAISSNPDNAVLHTNLSAIHLKMGSISSAIGQAEQAIKISPNWAKGYYRLGEAHRKQGDNRKCLLNLSQATWLDPKNVQVFQALQDSAMQFIDSFQLNILRNLGHDHNRAVILAVVGQNFHQQGNYEDAVKVLTWSLELGIGSVIYRESVLGALASSCDRLSDHKTLERLFELYGDSTTLLEHRIRSYFLEHDYNKCIHVLLPRAPKLSEYCTRVLCLSLLYMNREDDAVNFLNSAILENGNNKDTLIFCTVLLAEINILLGHLEVSWKLAKRILKYSRKTSYKYQQNAFRLLATICDLCNDFASAVKLWEQVEGSEARLSEAKCHVAMRTEFADEKLSIAVTTDPTSVEARSNRFRWRFEHGGDYHEDLKCLESFLSDKMDSNERTIIYHDLATSTSPEDSEKCLNLFEQGLTEAQDSGNLQAELTALCSIADKFENLNRKRESEGYYRQMLEVARQLKDPALIGEAHFKLAKLKNDTSEARKAATAFREGCDYSKLVEALLWLAEVEDDSNRHISTFARREAQAIIRREHLEKSLKDNQ